MSNFKCLTADEILSLIEDGNVSDWDDDDDDDDGDEQGGREKELSNHGSSLQERQADEEEFYEWAVQNQTEQSNRAANESEDVDSPSEIEIVSPGATSNHNVTRQKWVNTMNFSSGLRFKNSCNQVREDPQPNSNYHNERSRQNWDITKYFGQYIDKDVFEKIAFYTNLKSVQVTGKSILVTQNEIKKFLGICIYMSTIGYPRLRMFWEKATRLATVADNMSRDRFFQIRRFLKIVDDLGADSTTKKSDALWKVRPFLEKVRNGCLMLPRENRLSVDEQMIPFQGRCHMIQFVKGKPNPIGLKNFVLADNHGLVLDFVVYQGKGTFLETDSDYQLSIGESAVWKLSHTVPPKSCLYFDRWFTTHKLVHLLLTEKKKYFQPEQ